MRISLLLAGLLALPACKHAPDAHTVKEVSGPSGLSYLNEVDATRLERSTGLAAVPSVAQLLRQELAPFFRVRDGVAATEEHVELIAESPAPGYAVKVQVEARPDDFCVVSFTTVKQQDDGSMEGVSLAPYSIHFALWNVRNALSSLRPVNRPALDDETFEILRKQAAEARSRGGDQPIDEVTYARTPRPIERGDSGPRYFAPPVEAPSQLKK